MAKNLNRLNKVLNFSAERYFKSAGDLFIYDGAYESALYMVEKTLELEPNNVRALVLKSDILFCLNEDPDALKALNQALALNPQCAEAFISKAGILEVSGKYREALFCCNEALKYIQAGNRYLLPMLIDQKMMLLLRLRKPREAQRLLQDAQELLEKEDYNVLLSAYRSQLRHVKQNRAALKERSDFLSLKVITGTKK